MSNNWIKVNVGGKAQTLVLPPDIRNCDPRDVGRKVEDLLEALIEETP